MRSIKKVLILIIAIFALLQSLPLFATDEKANEIIKKLKDNYNKLKTLSAEYTQTFHWKLADNIHQQKGSIWLKGTEKFKIETEDQLIISDGKTIWTYSQFNNQVIIDNVRKSDEEVTLPRDIFLNYSEQYRPNYLKEDKIDNQNCYVIELFAKTEDIFIKYMKIWVNIKILVPMKIQQVDINDNENTYLLKNIQINEQLNDNFFVYKIPEAVEIIDMR